MTLPVIELDRIGAVAAPELVCEAARTALIAHAEARTLVPPPTHLEFDAVGGDAHVKAGYLAGERYWTVKVASGFPGNERIGRPSNSGVILALSTETGEPVAVLADEGWITAWRTAAVGALATDALAPAEATRVGVLGTGMQARLQAEWLHRLRPLSEVKVWGRRGGEASRMAAELAALGIDARACDMAEVLRQPCVITATPSRVPLAAAEAFAGTRHITALGADMPGKAELPPELFARATAIITDDHEQCLDHGDFGNAVRAGIVEDRADLALGRVLRDGLPDALLEASRGGPGEGQPARLPLSIADLTGVGAIDTAVVCAVLAALEQR